MGCVVPDHGNGVYRPSHRLITVASFKYGEKTLTRSDWISFVAALLVIPLWALTKNAALAAILISVIDGLGYYPTYRAA